MFVSRLPELSRLGGRSWSVRRSPLLCARSQWAGKNALRIGGARSRRRGPAISAQAPSSTRDVLHTLPMPRQQVPLSLRRQISPSLRVYRPVNVICEQCRRSHIHASSPAWRPSSALDEYDAISSILHQRGHISDKRRRRWVQREARPISLRQLTFFGRTLTQSRLLESANYVRTELPTR
jgi:hypothetical protein